MCKVTAAHSSAGMELFACRGVQGKTLGTGLFVPMLGKTKGGLKVSKTDGSVTVPLPPVSW